MGAQGRQWLYAVLKALASRTIRLRQDMYSIKVHRIPAAATDKLHQEQACMPFTSCKRQCQI